VCWSGVFHRASTGRARLVHQGDVDGGHAVKLGAALAALNQTNANDDEVGSID
jgi:hypothetical protein